MEDNLKKLSMYFKKSGLHGKNEELLKIIKKSQQNYYFQTMALKKIWETFFEMPAYAPVNEEQAAWIQQNGVTTEKFLHNQLSLLGMIPDAGVIFLTINAAIYASEGDYKSALVSLIGAILSGMSLPGASKAAENLGLAERIAAINPVVTKPIVEKVLEALSSYLTPFSSSQIILILNEFETLVGFDAINPADLANISAVISKGTINPGLIKISNLFTVQGCQKIYEMVASGTFENPEVPGGGPSDSKENKEQNTKSRIQDQNLIFLYESFSGPSWISVRLDSTGLYYVGNSRVYDPINLISEIQAGISSGAISRDHVAAANQIIQNVRNKISENRISSTTNAPRNTQSTSGS